MSGSHLGLSSGQPAPSGSASLPLDQSASLQPKETSPFVVGYGQAEEVLTRSGARVIDLGLLPDRVHGAIRRCGEELFAPHNGALLANSSVADPQIVRAFHSGDGEFVVFAQVAARSAKQQRAAFLVPDFLDLHPDRAEQYGDESDGRDGSRGRSRVGTLSGPHSITPSRTNDPALLRYDLSISGRGSQVQVDVREEAIILSQVVFSELALQVIGELRKALTSDTSNLDERDSVTANAIAKAKLGPRGWRAGVSKVELPVQPTAFSLLDTRGDYLSGFIRAAIYDQFLIEEARAMRLVSPPKFQKNTLSVELSDTRSSETLTIALGPDQTMRARWCGSLRD